MNNKGEQRLVKIILLLTDAEIKNFRRLMATTSEDSKVIRLLDHILKNQISPDTIKYNQKEFPNLAQLVNYTYHSIVRSLIIIKSDSRAGLGYYHGKTEALQSKGLFDEALAFAMEVQEIAKQIENFSLLLEFQRVAIDLIRDSGELDKYQKEWSRIFSEQDWAKTRFDEIFKLKSAFENVNHTRHRVNLLAPGALKELTDVCADQFFDPDRPFLSAIGEIIACRLKAELSTASRNFSTALDLYQRTISLFDCNKEMKEANNYDYYFTKLRIATLHVLSGNFKNARSILLECEKAIPVDSVVKPGLGAYFFATKLGFLVDSGHYSETIKMAGIVENELKKNTKMAPLFSA